MVENILKAELAQNAERWLLPEMQGTHLVPVSREKSSGGFKKKPTARSESGIPRAMTASHLAQLEQQAKTSGESSGRAEGYQQGYGEGQQKAVSLIEESHQRIDTLVATITDEIEREKDKLQTVFSGLLVRLCEAVCLRELRAESNIEEIVRRALAALPVGETQITVYLNPADYQFMSTSGDREQKWLMSASQDIEPGGCRIRSENSEIDFTLEERVDQIAAQVFEENLSPPAR